MTPAAPVTDWLAPPILAAAITSLVVVVVYFLGRFRENKLRFIAEKRAAYTELIAAELEQRSMAYKMDRLLTELEQHQLQARATVIVGWRAMRVKYQGQFSEESEAEAAKTDDEDEQALAGDPKLRALVAAEESSVDVDGAMESVVSDLDEQIKKTLADLETAADRKEEATANLDAALATVKLLAPRRTTAEFERAFADGAGDKHPTSTEFLAAMDQLVDAMRKDLGLGPRWRRRWWWWWRSPKRVATPEST